MESDPVNEPRRESSREWLPAAAFGLVGLCLLALTPVAEGAFPGRNGRIAASFDIETSSNSSDTQIWSFLPGGGGPRRLHTELDSGAELAFAPSGNKAALARDGILDDQAGIYLMRADGRGRRRLLARPGQGWEDSHPDWSPSGRAIVYQRSRTERSRGARIKVYRAGRSRTLAGGTTPVWSSRGTIAFNRGRGLYVMKGNGSRLRQVTVGRCLDWSPGGHWILLRTPRRDLAVVRPDGTGFRVLLRASTPSAQSLGYAGGRAAFSPDGTAVAASGSTLDEVGLYVLRLSRGAQRVPVPEPDDAFEVLDWQSLARR